MKFIDLDKLKVRTCYNVIDYVAELGEAEELFGLSVKDLNDLIKESFVIEPVSREDAVLLEAQIDNCDNPDDFEYLVNVITDALIAMLTTEKERQDREKRLGVPKNLKDNVNCNTVPLQKAINNECIANMFAIHIFDSVKGLDYNIVR